LAKDVIVTYFFKRDILGPDRFDGAAAAANNADNKNHR
jgi:hypothetical protein